MSRGKSPHTRSATLIARIPLRYPALNSLLTPEAWIPKSISFEFQTSDKMIADHISEVMIVTGLLTMGAIAAFLVPAKILKFVFGVVDANTGTRFIAQHWGLLVFLVGALLVFAGRHSEFRVPVLVVAATEKLVGSGLILTGPLRRRSAALVLVIADSLMALLYVLILLL